MRKLLLFCLLIIGVNANAQTDTTLSVSSANKVQPPADTTVKIICTDTVRLGNFYFTVLTGSRLAIDKGHYGDKNGYFTEWGKNYGGLIGYQTLNDRFSLETGYFVRSINNITRLGFFGRDYDLILETKVSQVPLYLKTRLLNKLNKRLTFRVITGMNFTAVNTTDFKLSGDFNLVSQKENTLILHSKNPYYMEEEFIVQRNLNTSKNKTNSHITPEIGLESGFKLSDKFEAGAFVTYQHNSKPFEELTSIRFVGNNRLGASDYTFQGPFRDATSFNLALFLRYNFNKLTFYRCNNTASAHK